MSQEGGKEKAIIFAFYGITMWESIYPHNYANLKGKTSLYTSFNASQKIRNLKKLELLLELLEIH